MQQNTWNLVRNRRGEEYSIFCVCVFLYFISLLGNKKNRMEMKLIKNEQSWENMLVERCNIQIGILLPEQLNMCTWVECVCGCENRLGEWAPSLLREGNTLPFIARITTTQTCTMQSESNWYVTRRVDIARTRALTQNKKKIKTGDSNQQTYMSRVSS